MPRRYYRRTRVVRPRKKWATNIITRNFTVGASSAIPYISLVSNAVQTSAPTPVIVKAGNFKVNADVDIGTSTTGTPAAHLHIVAFVVFLPEGIAPADNQQFGNLIAAHPEYIMAWRQIDTDFVSGGTESAAQSSNRVVFSSRLKRNLNSGDSIVFGVLDQSTQQALSIRVQLTCQYWTCSN